jgi:drug/metabolite transporter (DMT)-like permease
MFSPGVRYILLSTVFFSIMNVCVKYLEHIPSVQIVWFRSLVTLLISIYLLRKNHLKPFGNNTWLLLARGAVGAVALLSYFYSLQHMPLASAVTIQYLAPVFTVVLSVFILKEPVKWVSWLVLGISLAGVFLIKGFDPRISNYALAVGLLAAFSSGLAYNFVRKLKDHDDPLVIVFYFPLVTFPVVTPIMIGKWVPPTFYDLGLLLLVGIFTQFGQVYLTRAYMLEPASKIAGLSYAGLLFAMASGYFLFEEELGTMSVLGMMMIIGAVMFSIYIDQQKMKSTREANEQVGKA